MEQYSVQLLSISHQAERVVKIPKEAIKRATSTNKDVEIYSARFLLRYRNTRHSTIGIIPGMLLTGRRLRSHLDFMLPASTTKYQEHKFPTNSPIFEVGDSVQARNFIGSEKWISGSIEEVLDARHDLVKVDVFGNDAWIKLSDQ